MLHSKHPSRILGFIIVLLLGLISCQPSNKEDHGHHHGDANHHMNKRSFEELVANFEDTARLEWQKPDAVISALGDVHGQTIMDIGCGTGYFAFRLVDAGAKVICADVDERFQTYVSEKRKELGIEEKDLTLKMLPYDSPELADTSIHVAIIVNTYHHIEDRKLYFEKVRKGLKEGGRLMVVDFLKAELPEGPPLEMKLSAEEVMAELQEAGFSEFSVDEELLPYQYILLAEK